MFDNDLERAKQAIERKDYQKARTILEMMPDNQIAQKWLSKLNRNNFKFEHEKPFRFAASPIKEERGTIPILALIIIVLSMLFWALFILATVAMNQVTAQYQAVTVLIVLGAFVVLPVLYFLFWRWFWWMLALFWLLLTIGFIVALAMGYQFALPYL